MLKRKHEVIGFSTKSGRPVTGKGLKRLKGKSQIGKYLIEVRVGDRGHDRPAGQALAELLGIAVGEPVLTIFRYDDGIEVYARNKIMFSCHSQRETTWRSWTTSRCRPART